MTFVVYDYGGMAMKFVLFLMKTISLVLCISLFCMYLYFAFYQQPQNQFMSNATLLLFALSVVISAMAVVSAENKVREPKKQGLDAYIAELHKEEKDAANGVLPEKILPVLEQLQALLNQNQNSLEQKLSEQKNEVSSLFAENKKEMVDFNENILNQLTLLATKNLPPLNLALENINARLDDLENKIISNRTGYAENVIQTAAEPSAEIEKHTKDSISEFTEDTAAADEKTSEEIKEEVPVEKILKTPERFIEENTEEANISDNIQEYSDTIADVDNHAQFANELSDLANLEIMQEPVAPTAQEFEDVDIDAFLKDRTDVKN